MAQIAVQVAISFALSYAAQQLLQSRDRSIARDDKPTTLSTRGSYITWLNGRRRLAPVFSWAGDRTIKKERVDGPGKGTPKPEQNIYYEGGLQVYCLGPTHRLHRILQNGKSIFEGPIDSLSHPSGSLVSLGREGSFYIYWGERDQPINTRLGDPARVTISSRWPYATYLDWLEKRLGPAAIWQLIEAEFETRPFGTGLTRSAPWIEPTRTLAAILYPVVSTTSGGLGTAQIEVSGDVTQQFRPGFLLKLTGNSAPDGDYRILDTFYTGVTGTPPTSTFVNRTTIELSDPLIGANNAGNIQVYQDAEDDGVNAAHTLFQLLFAQYPHGIGLDSSLFNMDSLEALGQLIVNERLPMSIVATQGQNAQGTIATILQDLGVMIGFDNGKWRFKEIREQVSSAPAITDDMIVPPRPQFETSHRPAFADKTIYTFADRRRNFRDMTVNEDDDGALDETGRVNSKSVLIPTAIDFATAVKIAERREPEDSARPSGKRVNVSREGRQLFPGQAIDLAGALVRQRVISVTPATLSSRAELEVIDDNYGVPASTYTSGDGGGLNVPPTEVQADLAFEIVEVPEYLLTAVGQSIIVPRIRSGVQVMGADIYLSRDGTTYTHVLRTTQAQTGGTLVEALPNTSAILIENGPAVSWLGPDVGIVQDLSLDVTSWRAGRQVLVASDGVTVEIMFVRNILALGNNVYRLQGVVRRRFDSELANLQIGHRVFIFRNDEIDEISDILLAPGAQLYVKTQPFGVESFPLDQVTASTRQLIGKGIVPMACENLRTTNNSNSFRSGEDVPLVWTYRSAAIPHTGMGMQGYGNACGFSPVKGNFTLRFMNNAEVVKREVGSLISPSYYYTNSTMVQDFSGQPSSFLVEVETSNGGYKSVARRIQVVRVN